MKTGGSGSGRGSDVIIAAGRAAIIIAVKKFERAFQELSFEPNQSSVALFLHKLSVIENLCNVGLLDNPRVQIAMFDCPT